MSLKKNNSSWWFIDKLKIILYTFKLGSFGRGFAYSKNCFLIVKGFPLQETLHNHDIVDVEEEEYAIEQPSGVWSSYQKSIEGPIIVNINESIASPTCISPMGSFKDDLNDLPSTVTGILISNENVDQEEGECPCNKEDGNCNQQNGVNEPINKDIEVEDSNNASQCKGLNFNCSC